MNKLRICPKSVPKWIAFFLLFIVFHPAMATAEDEFQSFTETSSDVSVAEGSDEFAAFNEFESFEQNDNASVSCGSCSGDHSTCANKNGEKLV